MKIISCIEDVLTLDNEDLSTFIMTACVWLTEDWVPETTGFIFIIDEGDIHKLSALCIVPNISEDEDNSYRQLMTIDLAQFDLWESAVFDPASRYWEVVAILGQEYGCVIFITDKFVQSLPGLLQNLEKVKQQD